MKPSIACGMGIIRKTESQLQVANQKLSVMVLVIINHLLLNNFGLVGYKNGDWGFDKKKRVIGEMMKRLESILSWNMTIFMVNKEGNRL